LKGGPNVGYGERAYWLATAHSELITSPVDELIVKMLLCPACLEDDHTGDFESEAGD